MFHSWKCILKRRLRNGGHFVMGEMSSITADGHTVGWILDVSHDNYSLCVQVRHNPQLNGIHKYCTLNTVYVYNIFI